METYRVICGSSIASLEYQISDLLKHEGGTLIGGVFVFKYPDNSVGYFQAMLVSN